LPRGPARTALIQFCVVDHMRSIASGAASRPASAAQRRLDDEEQKVVPLAAMTLAQQEGDAVGRHGVAQIRRT